MGIRSTVRKVFIILSAVGMLTQVFISSASAAEECASILPGSVNPIRRFFDLFTFDIIDVEVPIEVTGCLSAESIDRRFPFSDQEAYDAIAKALRAAMADEFQSVFTKKLGLNSSRHVAVSVKDNYVKGYPARSNPGEFSEARALFTVIGQMIVTHPDGSAVTHHVMIGVEAPLPNSQQKLSVRATSFLTGQAVIELRNELAVFHRTKESRFAMERRPLSLVAITLLNDRDRRIAVETNEVWGDFKRKIHEIREILRYRRYDWEREGNRTQVENYQNELRILAEEPELWLKIRGPDYGFW